MGRHLRFPLVSGALLCLVVLAYANHFDNAFQFDDSHAIVNNAAIRDLGNIPSFFVDASTGSSLPQNQAYRPGLTTLNALDYALGGGLRPRVFHRSIFLSYLLLGVLLYFFYAHIAVHSSDRPWARLLALLGTGGFMVHAANAETINYIVQRADSFSTLMVLLGFVIYQYKPRWRRGFVYLLPMVVGFFVKSPALMFAPLLFVYLFLFETNGTEGSVGVKERLMASLRGSLPALILATALFLFWQRMTPDHWFPSSIPRFRYLITQPFVLVHYFDNFLLPVQLTADTDWRPLTTLADDRFFVGIAFILALGGIAVLSARKRETRPIAFGIAWFFIALIPTSSIFPLNEVFNDHRTFFPYIGLMLAASWTVGLLVQRHEDLFSRSPSARMLLGACVALFLLGHAAGTVRRNRVWATGESLWRDAVVKSPMNPRALLNFGITQMEKGDYAAAEGYFQTAVALAPTYSYLHINRGILYGVMARPTEAELAFQDALRYANLSPDPYYHYALWLEQQGRAVEATEMLSAALELSPIHAGALAATARIEANRSFDTLIAESVRLYNAGDGQGSLAAALRALELRPESDIALNNICAAHNQLQQWDQAIQACERALVLNPQSELARNNLAWARRERF